MSLIPYSGKISFFTSNSDRTIAEYGHSTPSEFLRGVYLYGSGGTKGGDLLEGYSWGNQLSGYPIRHRRGYRFVGYDYGDYKCYVSAGMLLSTEDPATSYMYKYFRYNPNPCYGGCANMLSIKCEKQCTYYLPNPYYMIEPTADMVKMYEMCNALYPIYDTYNVSNFIFAALEWANNMFQSWTRNPSAAAST